MIINWCLVAIVALIIGGICSLKKNDSDYFLGAIILVFCIGFGSVLVSA